MTHCTTIYAFAPSPARGDQRSRDASRSKDGSIWMPVYIADYMLETGTFTMEESGAYHQLLMYSWRYGPLPDDNVQLAILCRMTFHKWSHKLAPKLRPLFVATDAGLVSQKLEIERTKAMKNLTQKREANAARWNKRQPAEENNSSRFHDAAASASSERRSYPSPSPSPAPSPSTIEEKNDGASHSCQGRLTNGDLLPEAFSLEAPARDAELGRIVVSTGAPFAEPKQEAEDALAMWNAMATDLNLPVAQKLTVERRRKLHARLKDGGGLDGWRHALDCVRSSSHLRGESKGGWRCTFDFLVNPSNFTKVMEGNYRDHCGSRGSRNGVADFCDALRDQGVL